MQNAMARGGGMVPGKKMKNEAVRNKMKKRKRGKKGKRKKGKKEKRKKGKGERKKRKRKRGRNIFLLIYGTLLLIIVY